MCSLFRETTDTALAGIQIWKDFCDRAQARVAIGHVEKSNGTSMCAGIIAVGCEVPAFSAMENTDETTMFAKWAR